MQTPMRLLIRTRRYVSLRTGSGSGSASCFVSLVRTHFRKENRHILASCNIHVRAQRDTLGCADSARTKIESQRKTQHNGGKQSLYALARVRSQHSICTFHRLSRDRTHARFFFFLSPRIPYSYAHQRMQSIGTPRSADRGLSLPTALHSSGSGRGRSRKVALADVTQWCSLLVDLLGRSTVPSPLYACRFADGREEIAKTRGKSRVPRHDRRPLRAAFAKRLRERARRRGRRTRGTRDDVHRPRRYRDREFHDRRRGRLLSSTTAAVRSPALSLLYSTPFTYSARATRSRLAGALSRAAPRHADRFDELHTPPLCATRPRRLLRGRLLRFASLSSTRASDRASEFHRRPRKWLIAADLALGHRNDIRI